MDGANRIQIVELQDHNGNVIHPQTSAAGLWFPDGESLLEKTKGKTEEELNQRFDVILTGGIDNV